MVQHDDRFPNPATTSPLPISTGGLIISTNDSIRSFLEVASADCHLSEDLRDLSSSLIVHSSVPYKSLKNIWIWSEPDTRSDLSAILSSCKFVLASPKPTEKGEVLKARLAKLTEVAERKIYEELVKDITPRKHEVEPFSSYKDQLGFGRHVVLVMFTGYLLGYAAFRALFSHTPAMVNPDENRENKVSAHSTVQDRHMLRIHCREQPTRTDVCFLVLREAAEPCPQFTAETSCTRTAICCRDPRAPAAAHFRPSAQFIYPGRGRALGR